MLKSIPLKSSHRYSCSRGRLPQEVLWNNLKESSYWLAGLHIPPSSLNDEEEDEGEGSALLRWEIDCTRWIKARTSISLSVYGQIASVYNEIGAPFISRRGTPFWRWEVCFCHYRVLSHAPETGFPLLFFNNDWAPQHTAVENDYNMQGFIHWENLHVKIWTLLTAQQDCSSSKPQLPDQGTTIRTLYLRCKIRRFYTLPIMSGWGWCFGKGASVPSNGARRRKETRLPNNLWVIMSERWQSPCHSPRAKDKMKV